MLAINLLVCCLPRIIILIRFPTCNYFSPSENSETSSSSVCMSALLRKAHHYHLLCYHFTTIIIILVGNLKMM